MTVKRIAKSAFTVFLSFCVSWSVLDVLGVFGCDKYAYYSGGVVFFCLHIILDRATLEWRRK
jgi:hypothetical protein